MKIFKSLLILFVLLSQISCNDNDAVASQDFVIAFKEQSVDFSTIENSKTIQLTFSEKAAYAGSVTLNWTADQATYNTDFETFPNASSGQLTLDFAAGAAGVSFEFKNLIFPFDRSDKAVTFKITSINYGAPAVIQGYSSLLVSFDRAIGGTVLPDVGGPNQPNQVFVDLSTNQVVLSRRDLWDFGFYSGSEDRVVLNGSLYMAATALDQTNIDAVTPASVQGLINQVAVGTFDPTNENYIDDPKGDISETAIAEISANTADNKVYLVNMGYEIGTATPPVGSVAIAGASRGFKKIQIQKTAAGYKLLYANLEDTTHREMDIQKRPDYNFTFVSVTNHNQPQVEPLKNKWDLCFTVFTNLIAGNGSYGYSDFVLFNRKAGVKMYQVNTTQVSYANFNASHLEEQRFVLDQRVIGADWRDVFTGGAFTDRFYILKDTDGNVYKIKMLSMINTSGWRGYPSFEYRLVE